MYSFFSSLFFPFNVTMSECYFLRTRIVFYSFQNLIQRSGDNCSDENNENYPSFSRAGLVVTRAKIYL